MTSIQEEKKDKKKWKKKDIHISHFMGSVSVASHVLYTHDLSAH